MDRQFTERIGNRPDGTQWFTLTFLASRQEQALKGSEEWEKVCWDECLRRAHAKGLVPVGPILISDEDIKRPVAKKLDEGARLLPDPVSLVGAIFKVTCEVELGLSIDAGATTETHPMSTQSKSMEGIDTDGLSPEDIAWLDSL